MSKEEQALIKDLLDALPNVLDRIQASSLDMSGKHFYQFRNGTRAGRNAAQDVERLLNAWNRVRG